MLSDEQLLKAYIDGDRTALGTLAERYELPLLGLARGLLGGRRDLACDATQETWLRVIRFGASFNGQSSFKTWIYRIAINQCHNLRASLPVTQDPSSQQAHSLQIRREQEAPDTSRNERLMNAVQALGPDKQSIVLLCYHAGMTHEQAAQILDIPAGTLKSRLHAALQELRAGLASEGLP